MLLYYFMFIDREAGEIIRLVASVRLSVNPSVCQRSSQGALYHFVKKGGQFSTFKAKKGGQSSTFKAKKGVNALPFQPKFA